MLRRMRPLLCAVLALATSSAFAAPTLSDADVAPCKRSAKKFDGSLHAAVAYSTPMGAPKNGKTQLTVDCAGTPAAVYLFDFADKKEASLQAGFIGAQLWGPEGRSAEHNDQVLTKESLVVVVSGAKPEAVSDSLKKRGFAEYALRGEERAHPPVSEPSDAELQAWKASLDCKGMMAARYCAALDAFKAGKAPDAAPGPMLGASLLVGAEGLVEEVSYLVLNKDSAVYGSVSPSNAEERTQLGQLLVTLRANKPVPENDPVLGYVKSLATKPGYPLTASGKSSAFTHDSLTVYVRKTKSGYVAVERQRGEPAVYVAIFQ